eukprot:5742238-Amphidinium_carterae.1
MPAVTLPLVSKPCDTIGRYCWLALVHLHDFMVKIMFGHPRFGSSIVASPPPAAKRSDEEGVDLDSREG